MDWTPEELQAIVDEHALVLFMKGTPNQAQCGFSNRAAQVLQTLGEPVRCGQHPKRSTSNP